MPHKPNVYSVLVTRRIHKWIPIRRTFIPPEGSHVRHMTALAVASKYAAQEGTEQAYIILKVRKFLGVAQARNLKQVFASPTTTPIKRGS